MDFNKLTIKSQEAVAAAQELARRRGNPEIYPEHLLLALLDQELFARLAGPARARPSSKRRGAARGPGRRSSSRGLVRVLDASSTRPTTSAQQLEDDYVSTEHLFLALEPVPRDEILGLDQGGPRRPARHVAGSRGTYQALEKFGRDLTEAAEAGKARPGDRPRRGDPPRDPDPLAAHEEQPGADRRARRRQDRDRRRARAADRRRRRARGR